MTPRHALPLLAAISFLPLAGCVIVVDESGAIERHWAGEYDDEMRARAAANADLAARVRQRIDSDPVLRDQRISVAARGGELTLTGEVPDTAVLDRAVAATADVEGVEKVIANLRVEIPGRSKSQ